MTTAERPKYVPAPEGHRILIEAGIPLAKNTYYDGLRSGQIPSIRVGKKFFVREDIVEVMESSKKYAEADAQN